MTESADRGLGRRERPLRRARLALPRSDIRRCAGPGGCRERHHGGKQGAVLVMGDELDYWNNLPGRAVADTIYAVRGLKRAVRAWRYRR